MESKFAEANTPAKTAKTSTFALALSPPLMVLKDMGVDGSDSEFRAAASFNIKELHTTQVAFRQELFNQGTMICQQVGIMTALAEKDNVVAGLVGTPDPYIKAPSVWHVITRVHDGLRDLSTQTGGLFLKMKTQSQAGGLDNLLQAELQDVRSCMLAKRHVALQRLGHYLRSQNT
ncbi:hypothetical protein ACA910_010712 [Epithemia clementina (nom. ined.)]